MTKRSNTFEQRFWAKVKKTKSCWIWMGAKLPKGYGVLGNGPKGSGYTYAHRASYEINVGPIPDQMQVCHKCDNPNCVKPKHLFIGTQLDNVRDMRKKKRGTFGETHPNAILTDEDVVNIRNDYEAGDVTFFDLAEKYKISFQHAHTIVRNKQRRNV